MWLVLDVSGFDARIGDIKSKLYKLILDNQIIAEGSKSDMKKQLKRLPAERRPFVGQSPSKNIGDIWNGIGTRSVCEQLAALL